MVRCKQYAAEVVEGSAREVATRRKQRLLEVEFLCVQTFFFFVLLVLVLAAAAPSRLYGLPRPLLPPKLPLARGADLVEGQLRGPFVEVLRGL